MTRSFARLAVFESLRLARSPFLLLALGFSLAIVVGPATRYASFLEPVAESWDFRTTEALPTWGAITDETISSAKYIAAGMFFAAFPPALREARHGHSVVAPLDRGARVAALVAATTIVGGLAGTASFATLLVPRGPVAIAGGISPAAFAVALVLPMVGGAFGVLVGTWTRSWVTMIAAGAATVAYGAARFITVPLVDEFYGLPDTVVQPAGLYDPGKWGIAPTHLAYILLLLGICVAVAQLRYVRSRWGTAGFAAAATLCLVGSAGGFASQYGEGDLIGSDSAEWSAWAAPKGRQVCRTGEAVTYCAHEDYEHWIPYWQDVVEPVVNALPESEREGLPRVVQTSFADPEVAYSPSGWLDRGIADPGTTWYPDDAALQIDLADQFVLTALDIPGYRDWTCRLGGQARLAVYLWLTTYATDGGHEPLYPVYEDHAKVPAYDVALAMKLSETPDDRVIAALHEHWDRLADPATTPDEGAELLGVRITDDDVERANAILATARESMPLAKEYTTVEETDAIPRWRASLEGLAPLPPCV